MSRQSGLLRAFMALLLVIMASLAPLGLVQTEANAAPVTFRWDYTVSGAAGFVLYCGPSSKNYPTRVDVGNTDTHTIATLPEGATSFCAVTAYDPAKVESSFSNEVSLLVPPAAPVVNFSASRTSGAAPLSVAFTNGSTGQVTTWAWNFGDGTTSNVQSPTHVYSAPGSYTVVLTATGAGGTASKTAATAISVSAPTPPAVNFSASPTSGAAPLSVAFTNTTTGQVTTWAWNFGDGTTSNVQNPTHVYSAPGSYTVVLTATGAGGTASKTAATAISVAAPTPPVVNFSASPTSGAAPLSVAFTNTTTGQVTTWAWNFGDGTTSNVQNPTHVYSAPGSYTVVLTATGAGGTASKTAATAISVAAPTPPVVNFSASPTSGAAPLSVAFTNTTTGQVTTWAWNFGDGTTSNVQSPTHVYSAAGSYTVVLTAIGAGGKASKTAATAISVAAPTPPIVNFSASPASGAAPLSVAFTNTTTGQVTTWAWNFGDGTTSNLKSPTHLYSTPGSYKVTLTATGTGGTASKTAATAISVTTAPSTPPSTGLVAAYAFNEGAGTSVTDASGKGNTGTLNGATWTTQGRFGGALTFDGVSKVNIPDSAGLRLTTGMTLEAWVNPSTVSSAWRDVIYKGNDNYYLEATSTSGAVPAAGGSLGKVNGTGPLAANTWTHLAVTYDLSTLRLYVNGIQVSSLARTVSMPTSTNPLQIGGDSIYGQYFQGSIDEVRVYNRALSQTEIQSDMNTPVAPLAGPAGVPVVNFSSSPMSGAAPLNVAFSNTTTGQVTTWAWSFGDGTTSNLQNPTHVYSVPGSYTAVLTATGPGGTASKTAAAAIVASVAPPASGLVAAYAFNEGAGTSVTDASGKGNTGTLNGATWTTQGRFGGALTFNGVSKVNIPDSAGLRLTTGMTLEAWVNPSTVSSAWRDVIYKGDDNYYLEATSTTGGVPAAGGTFAGASGTAPLAANSWTHLAATYDGATLRLYVNGVQVSSVAYAGSLATSPNPLQIGGNSIFGQYFQGSIDEVRVYNRALSQTAIQADMNTPIVQ